MDNVNQFSLGDVVTTKDELARWQLEDCELPKPLVVTGVSSGDGGFAYEVACWGDDARDVTRHGPIPGRESHRVNAFELVAYPKPPTETK